MQVNLDPALVVDLAGVKRAEKSLSAGFERIQPRYRARTGVRLWLQGRERLEDAVVP